MVYDLSQEGIVQFIHDNSIRLRILDRLIADSIKNQNTKSVERYSAEQKMLRNIVKYYVPPVRGD